MTTDVGVLLIRRVRWWAEGRAAKPRHAAVGLSEDELTRAYRGIDGAAWPDEISIGVGHDSGLAAVSEWPRVFAAATEHTADTTYDAIILAKPPGTTIEVSGVEFLGFDFGYYEDEYRVFSSIFHEAIHSPVAEMRRHATELNQALLFSTASQVDAYRRTRNAVLQAGQDVENEECYPLMVFGAPR